MTTGRLAPSPTGAQHLGNARTFLIAFWAMRAAGGKLRLRIEDLDTPRTKPWATDQAIEDLTWLGIGWDGPVVIQSHRAAAHAAALKALIHCDRVYPCVCTRRDIEQAASAPHETGGISIDGPIYPGTCSGWHSGDPLPPTGSYCWRFRVDPVAMTLIDRVAGSVTIDAASLGDFPVTRKTGEPAYQLAVVVDDADAGIDDIVRGDDLLTSTFRQTQIAAALRDAGWTPQQPWRQIAYAHVPLVVGTDGRRLAKRHGDTRLSTYRDGGVTAESIVRWAAGTIGLERRGLNLLELHEEAIGQFDWEKVSGPAVTTIRRHRSLTEIDLR